MNTPQKLLEKQMETREVLAGRICKSLLAKGYESAVFRRSAEAAAQTVLERIPAGASVGIPGSVTVRQLGLLEALAERGNVVHQHWGYDYTFADKEKQNQSDWFVTGSNAITRDGVMVNIDGAGNRIACMAWGRGEVIYVIGMNKVTWDLESAIARAHHYASPPNATRTSANTPCVQTGFCMNCEASERICRVMLIAERAPLGRKCHVILIGEDLGY